MKMISWQNIDPYRQHEHPANHSTNLTMQKRLSDLLMRDPIHSDILILPEGSVLVRRRWASQGWASCLSLPPTILTTW